MRTSSSGELWGEIVAPSCACNAALPCIAMTWVNRSSSVSVLECRESCENSGLWRLRTFANTQRRSRCKTTFWSHGRVRQHSWLTAPTLLLFRPRRAIASVCVRVLHNHLPFLMRSHHGAAAGGQRAVEAPLGRDPAAAGCAHPAGRLCALRPGASLLSYKFRCALVTWCNSRSGM